MGRDHSLCADCIQSIDQALLLGRHEIHPTSVVRFACLLAIPGCGPQFTCGLDQVPWTVWLCGLSHGSTLERGGLIWPIVECRRRLVIEHFDVIEHRTGTGRFSGQNAGQAQSQHPARTQTRSGSEAGHGLAAFLTALTGNVSRRHAARNVRKRTYIAPAKG